MGIENTVEIYISKDGAIQLSVQFEEDTVWLNQEQLSRLFDRDRTVIGRHIRSIFKEGELVEDVVCANFAHTTKHGAVKGKIQRKSIKYYNLDVIISVGYRVKSLRGTQFRIWANQILKEFLIKGYTINEKRLAQKDQEIQQIKGGLQIFTRAIEAKSEENTWLTVFAKGLKLLDDYDQENLDIDGLTFREAQYPSIEEYYEIVNQMKVEFESKVFGIEKDRSFQSSVLQIAKGFGESDFYPSIEEKAAMLLYLIVKNHSFVDGNKRIAAACFLKFLGENQRLFDVQRQPIISNDTLASITLFIASSKPDEMETVKRLVISVLNRNLE